MKLPFTNHILFNIVEGLGGATGTTRYFEDDVYAKKDLTNEILEKLSRKENVILEVQSLFHINPVLRKNVGCYVFTSGVDLYPKDEVVFPEKLREVVYATFGGGYPTGVKSYSRVIFNRVKNTLTAQIDYKL